MIAEKGKKVYIHAVKKLLYLRLKTGIKYQFYLFTKIINKEYKYLKKTPKRLN